MIPQVISSSREVPEFDLFDVVIVSIDTLRILRPDVKQENEYDVHRSMQQILMSSKDRVKASMEMQGVATTREGSKIIWTDDICARFKHIAVDESQN